MPRLATRLLAAYAIVSASPIFCQSANQIEPNAGKWKTWIISSGRDYRVPPPPGDADTKFELDWLRGFVAEKSPEVAGQVAYWDAGSPAYRWMDLMTNRVIAGVNIT